MKKIVYLLLVLIPILAKGQAKDSIQAKNAIYLEIGGTGIVYSINYDRIVYQKRFKISLRAGLEYIPDITNNPRRGSFEDEWLHIVGLPLEGNILIGRRKNYLELGLGVLPLIYEDFEFSSGERKTFFDLYIAPKIGYRYQRNEKGFFFKASYTPFPIQLNPENEEKTLERYLWFGFSFGSSF